MKIWFKILSGLLIVVVGLVFALLNYDNILYEKYKLALDIAEYSNEKDYFMEYVEIEARRFFLNLGESFFILTISIITMVTLWFSAYRDTQEEVESIEEETEDEVNA